MKPLDPDRLLPPDFQGWSYDHPIFCSLVAEVRPSTIVEVGSWKGMSAIELYRAAASLGLDFRLICVDTWLGSAEHMPGQSAGGLYRSDRNWPDLYQQFLSNMQAASCMERLETIPNTSLNAARWLERNGVRPDLIYIDGSHDTPDVYHDVSFYHRLLRDGGVIFGDDIYHPPLREDLDRYCHEAGIGYESVDGQYWLVRK